MPRIPFFTLLRRVAGGLTLASVAVMFLLATIFGDLDAAKALGVASYLLLTASVALALLEGTRLVSRKQPHRSLPVPPGKLP